MSISFDYDESLEKELYPNKNILEFVWEARKKAFENHIRHIFSTRTIKSAYEMEEAGLEIDTIIQSVFIKEMNADDINILIGNMKLDRSTNPYLDKLYDILNEMYR